jgi:predicted nucleic acid-binding protein
MKTVVLDPSAGVEAALDVQFAERLREYLGRDRVVSSDYYRVEAANVMWKRTTLRDDPLPQDQAQEMLVDALAWVSDFETTDAKTMVATLDAAMENNHPVYDMLYMVMARNKDTVLITVDSKQAAVAIKMGVKVWPMAGIK